MARPTTSTVPSYLVFGNYEVRENEMPKNDKEWRKAHDDHVADEDGKYLFLVGDVDLLDQIVEEHNIIRRLGIMPIYKWLTKVRASLPF